MVYEIGKLLWSMCLLACCLIFVFFFSCVAVWLFD